MDKLIKKIIVVILCIFTGLSNADATYTRGHIRHNGTKITRVTGYHKTRSDKIRSNNFSTKGNKNPYTGKKGYKKIKRGAQK